MNNLLRALRLIEALEKTDQWVETQKPEEASWGESGARWLSDGKDRVVEKPGHEEAIYHDLAHNFFKIPGVSPTKVVGEATHQREIPGAHHLSDSDPRGWDTYHAAVRNGDVERLAVVDSLMGKMDRHSGNFMVSPRGFYHVDNSDLFRERRDIPDYLHYHPDGQRLADKKLNPETVSWVRGLSEKEFDHHLAKWGVRPRSGTLAYLKRVVTPDTTVGEVSRL